MLDLVCSFESAQILNCTSDNVRRLVREGQLQPAVSTRAGRLFLRRDVEALAAERRQRDVERRVLVGA